MSDIEINVQEILYEIQDEWEMSGLADGLYGDFAKEAVTRVLLKIKEQLQSEPCEATCRPGHPHFIDCSDF